MFEKIKNLIRKSCCSDWYSSQEEKEKIVSERVEAVLSKVRKNDKKIHPQYYYRHRPVG